MPGEEVGTLSTPSPPRPSNTAWHQSLPQARTPVPPLQGPSPVLTPEGALDLPLSPSHPLRRTRIRFRLQT